MHNQTSGGPVAVSFRANQSNEFYRAVTDLQDFSRATCRFCFSGVASVLLIVWLKLHTFLGHAARRYQCYG